MLKPISSEEKTSVNSKSYYFSGFSFNTHNKALALNSKHLPLAPKPAQFLALLLQHSGQLVSNKQLIEHIWGDSIVDYQQNLHYTAKMVRKTLGDNASAPQFIETVPRAGYRFIGQLKSEKTISVEKSSDKKIPLNKFIYSLITVLLFAVLMFQLLYPGKNNLILEDRKWINAVHLFNQPNKEGWQRGLILTAQLIEQYPQSAKAYALHARALHHNQKNASLIESTIEKAITLDKNEALAWRQSGYWKMFRLQLPKQAQVDLERSAKLDPSDSKNLYYLALALFVNDDMQGAITRLEQAAKLDPISTQIHADLGWYYLNSGLIEKAKQECEYTLTLVPDNQFAHRCLLDIALLHFDQKTALEHAVQIANLLGATELEQKTIQKQWRLTQDKAFFLWYVNYYKSLNTKSGWHSPSLAAAYVRLGKNAEAVQIMRKTKESGHPAFMFMSRIPDLKELFLQSDL